MWYCGLCSLLTFHSFLKRICNLMDSPPRPPHSRRESVRSRSPVRCHWSTKQDVQWSARKKNTRGLKLSQTPPADDSFCSEHAIGYSPSKLPVDLQWNPHRCVGSRQGERCVSFPVHDVNVGASGQEQTAGRKQCVKLNSFYSSWKQRSMISLDIKNTSE